jgi:hypothetical protein
VTATLAVAVAALGLSTVYARLAPHLKMRTAGREGRVIRVQVLNGSGEGGEGSRVAAFLREGGFHVVEVGNADLSDYPATLVVARRTDPSAARAVARYLGGLPMIRQAWSSDLAEVTVVLGRDRGRLKIEP